MIECASCGRPTPAGSHVQRVMCPECVAAGKEFPREVQMLLFPATQPEG